MFSETNRTIIVVGAQWGDEGKGKLVDVLAERADWVVRYQGGANAGHTVHIGEVSFVLHQIPSGILHPGVRCAIGNGVVLDPDTLFHEIDELVQDGVDVEGRLYVSERAHLVLPYHKLVDAESAASKAIGTTGRGIGPAYEDKVARRGVRVLDLRHPARLRELVEAGAAHAEGQLGRFGSAKRVDVDETIALLERPQGSLLDIDHGTYPYVTSSSTTSGGAAIGVGIAPTAIDAVLGVVKAYTTRVGNGPLPTEIPGELGEEVRRLGNEFGATTGRARRCGWFDAVVVRYATTVNGFTSLAMTKLDVLDGCKELKVCTGYRYQGQLYRDMPADLQTLTECEPVYKRFKGWSSSTTGTTNYRTLPVEAKRYLEYLEEVSECPIDIVSTGSKRDATI